MKMRFPFILFCFLTISRVWADGDIDQQNMGSENINQPAEQAKNKPFGFASHFIYMSPAKISEGFYKGDVVHFVEAKVEASSVVYYDPVRTEGLILSLGFEPTYLEWEQNPYFCQNHFYLLPVSLTGFSHRIEDWVWRTQVTANFDTDKWSGKYTSYDFLLWGRYSLRKSIGIHFGFWLETGLRMKRIYPILGFDWKISRRWTLNLVYPMNISLNYAMTPEWIFALAGRNFNSRFRVQKDDYLCKSLVRYTNVGGECAIKYQSDLLSANVHGGIAFAGKLRVANQDNHHPSNYNLDASLYTGFEVEIKF